jgi:hypothetical protein
VHFLRSGFLSVLIVRKNFLLIWRLVFQLEGRTLRVLENLALRISRHGLRNYREAAKSL